jgi:hypothetical protein
MQAFTRRQELDRVTGDAATEQSLQLRNAQIGETMAQAEQRRLEPFLKAEELRAQNERFEATERGRNQRADATNKTRVQTAAESNELRKKEFEERQRHNLATENKPTSNTRTVANTIFERDDDGVWRVAPGAPPPFTPADMRTAEREGERSTERDEKGRQAKALFEKGAQYWDQAKQKREEARQLGLGPDGNPSRIRATQNDDSIKRLMREAEKLEEKTRDVQVQGDLLAAQSESGPAAQPSKSGGGKAFDLGRWKRDHPGADPSAVIERARKANMRIIE